VNKLIIIVLVAIATPAFAQPATVSPFGSSPHVVAYDPPAVPDRAHRGLTLEIALGGGTTSLDTNAGAITFAIGGWITRELSLAFRVSQVGSVGFVGGSAQYYATRSLWLGAGAGGLSERAMDEYGGFTRDDGTGGFIRAGYNLARGGKHALYVSGELQGGVVEDVTRMVALFSLGYQML
jgi:hypothetical protein